MTLLLCLNTSAKDRSIYDYSYEELAQLSITSTSFFEMSIAESPGYVQVFDLSKLELGAHYSLSNIIEQHAVGSSIGSHERHGALHGVRGIIIDNSAKTLLMVNGQQINPRSHFGASLSLNSPFLGDIQKVEVINGPGAIIHGSGAINGFINLIPKNGQENNGGFTSLTYGFKDQLAKLESGYGLSFSPEHNLYVYVGVIDAEGFEANEGYGLNKADYSSYKTKAWTNDNFRISTFWKFQSFNLQAIYQELNASTHNALEPNAAHSTYLALQPRLTINIGSSEDLEIVNSLFWHEHAFVFSGLIQGGREWHSENKLIFRTTRLTNHSLALGGLYGIKQFDQEKQFFRNKLKGGAEAADTNWQEYSFFMEDIWHATEKFNISLGLRYDKYMLEEINTSGISFSPEDGDQLSPRLALHYQINNSHNIKLSYQHGFRMPDAAYYNWFTINNNAAQALGFESVTLEPETMDSYEFNYKWNTTQRFTLELNLYYNEFEDQLSWGPLQNIWTDAEVLAINAFNGVTWGGG
ncbi:MAG: TonB-dependent receptor, partial [Lentisphaeraceae bacterium]|nr:TonB-dependent receptor [Lentisphaeraceae bacterium]